MASAELYGRRAGGIECHYVEYPRPIRERAAELAEASGLIPTGGSDYHERYKPGIEVGVGRGDLDVPDETVERLAAARVQGSG